MIIDAADNRPQDVPVVFVPELIGSAQEGFDVIKLKNSFVGTSTAVAPPT